MPERVQSTHLTTNEEDDGPIAGGFRASLLGASLPDLVQMECLAQSTASFRVISGQRIGYLFFRAGQMVHAMTDNLTGDKAALEILSWQQGSFEPCNVAAPERTTIVSIWQQLLMQAAQARDESPRRRIVPLTTKRANATRSAAPAPVSATQTTPVFPFDGFVRVDSEGNVVSARGSSSELAEMASYVARLGQLIGESLGMERFLALECVYDDARCVLGVESSGGVTALLAAHDADVSAIRKRFGI